MARGIAGVLWEVRQLQGALHNHGLGMGQQASEIGTYRSVATNLNPSDNPDA